MAHRFARRVLPVLALVASLTPLAAAQRPAPSTQAAPDPWYGRMDKPKNIDPPKVFANTFTIELPKDWQLVAGHAATIFSVAEKTKRFEAGAAITLDYMALQGRFDPSLLDALAPIELEDVKRLELGGSGFTQKTKVADGRPLIIIQYERQGLTGAADHVTQYLFPVGSTMYHLVCVAPNGQVEKYRAIFAHVAASFTPLQKNAS